MDRLALNNTAIDRTLDIFAETDVLSAARASVALSELLAPVQRSAWPEINYSFSRLTGDGFPVEFTFSSATNAISYTTEIAGPEIPEGKKIIRAGRLLSAYGMQMKNNCVDELINRLSRQTQLRYGAWLGGRHGPDTTDRYKAYLEITKDCQDIGIQFLQSFAPASSAFNSCNYTLRMMSVDSQRKVEYYFRLSNIDTWQLQFVMRSLGLAEQGKELIEFMQLISKRRIDQSFIGDNLGFSISTGADGLPAAVSLFTFNYKVFEPGDRFIRVKLLELSDRFSWDFNTYARITEPLAKKEGRLTHHGLVAFSITREGMKVVQVGLRPPGIISSSFN